MALSEQIALGFDFDLPDDNSTAHTVPEGWRRAPLEALCDINPSRKGRTNYSDDLPVTFVPMSAVDETTGTIARPEVKPYGEVKKGYTWFVENDVLFAKITPCMQNGKAAIARHLSNGVGFGSTEFHVLRPGPDVLAEWIFLFIRQPSFRAAAAQHFTGSVGQQRVPESFLLGQMLPVPLLPEQRRIVARIEELAGRVERARGLRREVVESAILAADQAKANLIDDLQHTAIPLGTLLRENSQNGLPQRPNDAPPGIPILRISAATSRTDARVDESDCKYLELDDGDIAKFVLEPGDLLACRFNGNLHYVGRFALYEGYSCSRHVYPDKLIRFRVDTRKVLPTFVLYAMNSPKGRKAVESFCSTTAGNIGISAGNLKTISLPIPPLEEQTRIVAYLDGIQAKVDALRQLRSGSDADLDALLPAVLSKAFKGEP